MQNARLLVHVGLAKTATTTLQKGLFTELHQAGLIHYLGKHAQRGTSWQTISIRKNRQNLLNHLVDPVSDRRLINSLIRSDRLNVYSDEFLTAPAFQIEKRTARLADPLDFPVRLAGFLENSQLDIHILLVLRNQVTRIPSQYAESYHLYADDEQYSRFSDYLGFRLENRKLFSCDDYTALLTAYQTVFGKDHVHILFFEDLQQQRWDFISGLGRILNLDARTIDKHLGSHHFNQKPRQNGRVSGTRYRSGRVHQATRLIYAKTKQILPGLVHKLEQHPALDKLKTWHQSQGKIVHEVYPIPPLQEAEKQRLMSVFLRSNERLAIDHALDCEKLIRYGYLSDPEQLRYAKIKNPEN